MIKIEATEVRKAFSKTLSEARAGEHFVIMKRGRPAAALVSVGDLRLLRRIEARQDALDLAEIRKVRAEIASRGTIPWERLKAELGLDMATGPRYAVEFTEAAARSSPPSRPDSAPRSAVRSTG